MKKLTLILTIFALLMISAAPTETLRSNTAFAVGISNPWKEVESLTALNEKAGVNLHLPPVMGVSNVVCRLLETEENSIAELLFCMNGCDYVFRACADLISDISGVYLPEGKTAFEGREAETELFAATDDLYLARWINAEGQYVLLANRKQLPDETIFRTVADELMELTRPEQETYVREGVYQDVVSQRAMATVAKVEEGIYAIEINWANSAFEGYVWRMTAHLAEDGRLIYSDCTLTLTACHEDGTQTQTPIELAKDGYFVLTENGFAWSGAAEENCRECVFEALDE